jgi:hypothetical protein
MTTLTGSTAATLSGTVKPPSFAEAIFGAVVQNSILFYIWSQHTSFGTCLSDGVDKCWADPWARQVVVSLSLCLALWLYSLRTIPSTGTSDPSIVDRLWSILPWLYCWHWCEPLTSNRAPLHSCACSPRVGHHQTSRAGTFPRHRHVYC